MNASQVGADRPDPLPEMVCTDCPAYELNLCRAVMNAGLLPSPHDQAAQTAAARRIVCRGPDLTDVVPIICGGWAASMVNLSSGGRQILSFLLPGDLVSTSMLFEAPSQLVVEAITDVRYRTFNRAELRTLLFDRKDLFEMLSKVWMEEKVRSDQLIVGLGRRSADERIAQLIMSLKERLEKRGLVRDLAFEFPLRQHHIADAMGLTPVHVSKVLSEFRRIGLIELNDRALRVLDPGRLGQIAAIR